MLDIEPLDLDADDVRFALAAMSAPLAALAPRAQQILRLTSAFAPGLVIIGGEFALSPDDARAAGRPTISATGTGLTLPEALLGFLGEAAEHLSQFERPGVVTAMHSNATARTRGDAYVDGWIGAHLAAQSDTTNLAWTVAECQGSAVFIPADLSFRRAPDVVALPAVGALSSGCAAGATHEAATERAILELIERDAAALWWFGGRPPAMVDAATIAAGQRTLDAVRCGATTRLTTLLDLTTDIGIPVMAAVSVNADGRGFACGLGARRDAGEALSAAIRELCQMELSAPLAAIKVQARGFEAISDADRRHLHRASFDASAFALLRPTARIARHAQFDGRTLPAMLSASGIPLASLNLTRSEIGVPVVRAFASHLQPFAEGPVTRRLQVATTEFGGGAAARSGMPLM